MGIAGACARLRFLNLDGCHVPGSCVVRVLAARQGIRFCHQLACLADEAEESPMWRDAQARYFWVASSYVWQGHYLCLLAGLLRQKVQGEPVC